MKYSEPIPGTKGNYNWSVRFDSNRGYLGISQTREADVGGSQRILLSPKQVKALLAFVGKEA